MSFTWSNLNFVSAFSHSFPIVWLPCRIPPCVASRNTSFVIYLDLHSSLKLLRSKKFSLKMRVIEVCNYAKYNNYVNLRCLKIS